VAEAMAPFWAETYGNPSSHHWAGRAASRAVEDARGRLADALNARPHEIVFTGAGSESNNLALRGVMLAARAAGRGEHLITSAVEHSAVLETARQLRDLFGFELTILPVDGDGRVRPDEVAAALRPDTVLVSLMAAQNEIGTIQPWREVGAMARAAGALFHTDAVQLAAARVWDMAADPVDLLTLAPHKFYGPKGVGILYVREGVDLVPAQTGGAHEDGRRAGTLNVPLIVGAAEAFCLAQAEMPARVAHVTALRDRLIDGLLAALPDDCILTGSREQRLPHHASFALRNLSGNDLLMHLDMAGIAASSGSACSSGDPKPSAVLQALGLGPEWATGGLRFTAGMQNTEADIDATLDHLPRIVSTLRRLATQLAPA
jgi:cysteine desulfurase